MRITMADLKRLGLEYEVQGGNPASTGGDRSHPEDDFQRELLEVSGLLGWKRAHFRPAMTADGRWITAVAGDGKGFPDLILLRERLIVTELKVKPNKPSKEQRAWLEGFIAAGVETYLWYPEDWDEIQRVLQ